MEKSSDTADAQLTDETLNVVKCKNHGAFKIRWEHIAMAVLGGVAFASTGVLYMQWKHASLGRKLSKDVLEFLVQHGAIVHGKKIMGGPVSVQMETSEAVISTVDTILKDISRRAVRAPHKKTDFDPDHQQQMNSSQPQPQPQLSNGGRPTQQQQQSSNPDTRQGPPEFPEPPISGKTGRPVSREDISVSGSFSSESGAVDQDFSYTAPMPPGMRPPGQIPS